MVPHRHRRFRQDFIVEAPAVLQPYQLLLFGVDLRVKLPAGTINKQSLVLEKQVNVE